MIRVAFGFTVMAKFRSKQKPATGLIDTAGPGPLATGACWLLLARSNAVDYRNLIDGCRVLPDDTLMCQIEYNTVSLLVLLSFLTVLLSSREQICSPPPWVKCLVSSFVLSLPLPGATLASVTLAFSPPSPRASL